MIHPRPVLASAATLAAILTAVLLASGCGGGAQNPPTPTETTGSPAPAPGAPPPSAPGSGAPPASSPKPLEIPEPDKVVAKVNDASIVRRRVFGLADANKNRIQSEGRRLPPEADGDLRRMALSLLIQGELLTQAARAQGMVPDEKTVGDLIGRARARFATEEEYKKYLADAGVTPDDVRKDAEARVLMDAYQASLTANVRATEDEARKFYDANPAVFKGSDEARILHILVRSTPNDPPAKRADARKRVDEALGRVRKGEDFAAVAKQVSQAPNAAKGGDTGFFPMGVMFPKIEETAFTAPIGSISDVFETPLGFNLAKVMERREGKVEPFEKVKPFVLDQLTKQKQSQTVGAKLVELGSKARIEILDPDLKPKPPQPAAEGAPPAKQAPSRSSAG